MGESKTRPLGLFDLFWLVAASAVGLAMVQQWIIPWWYGHPPAYVLADIRSRGGIVAPYHVFYWVQLVTPFLLALNVAWIPIRLRRPRPRWRLLLRQPGFVGSLAMVSALISTAVIWVCLQVPGWLGSRIVARSLLGFRYAVGFHAYDMAVVAIGHAVLAAWLLHASAGRWRAEPSWVDRAGRALGLTWIALLPINYWAALINP